MTDLLKIKVDNYLDTFVKDRAYQIKIYAPYINDDLADTSKHELELSWYNEIISMLEDIKEAI
tara:strand:- start:63 stop:251 length:189 start_codon:yes stop_codon:yes gene_type:complete